MVALVKQGSALLARGWVTARLISRWHLSGLVAVASNACEIVLTCQDLFKHEGSPKTPASRFPKAHLHALLADLIHMGGLGTPGTLGNFREDATILLI